MKFLRKLAIGIIFFFVLFHFTSFSVFAKSIDEELAEIAESLRLLEIAEAPLKQEFSELKVKVADIERRIRGVESRVVQLGKDIDKRMADLVFQKALFEKRVRNQYIKQRASSSPLLLLFSTIKAMDLSQEISANRMATQRDQEEIIKLAEMLLQLKKDKDHLEEEKISLANVKETFNKRAGFLAGEIKNAEEYRAQLNARQKELIAKKLASLNLPTSLGAGPLYCVDDRNIDPGFRPAFAFFTFGIPHRVGMNQYGALGRAKAGQNYRQILENYFSGISFETRDPNLKIKVQGYGEKALDEYLLGIYEMPGDWPIDALKAQVVAARSYALSYTDNGAKEICITQACQVYKGGNKGGDWERAVRETTGEVMVSGGQSITAWYASTAGGYTYRSSDVGWQDRPWTKRMQDTVGSANNFAELMDKAYDKESPCFYAAQGWRAEYNKSAWLKAEEVADIVNALLLAKKDSNTQDHLYQPDKPHPYGGEIWNQEKVKQELRQRGTTPFNGIDSASVSGVDWGLGKTTSISFSGDGGSVTFDANEFRDYFNLRAPANIQIVGPLFNIEKK